MAYWLDYSAAKLSGPTISGAGYTGAIRYIDSPQMLSDKHTNLAEYTSLRAAGLSVWLVFEVNTNDPDGGFSAGVANATRAKAGADMLGYSGPIFFCNDRTTVPNPSTWQAYLDGAASVLGIGRVGAYGFYGAMGFAVGHASYFWQAGQISDVLPHVHIWQDNNTQVQVGGITCDRNLILKDLVSAATVLAPTSDTLAALYTEDSLMRVARGGAAGGIDKAVNVQLAVSMLREHDIVIAPGDQSVILYGAYNWSWNDKGTGGNPVADPNLPIEVKAKGSYSFIAPKGTGKVDLVFWSDDDFTVGVFPR